MGKKKKKAHSCHLGIWQAPSFPHSLQDQHNLKLYECGPKAFKNAKKIVSSESGEGKEKVQIIVLKQKIFKVV